MINTANNHIVMQTKYIFMISRGDPRGRLPLSFQTKRASTPYTSHQARGECKAFDESKTEFWICHSERSEESIKHNLITNKPSS
jgi:hypothetical protein